MHTDSEEGIVPRKKIRIRNYPNDNDSKIYLEIKNYGHEDQKKKLIAGIVLTGGASKIEGATELAEEIFHSPVRMGSPHSVEGFSEIINNPIYPCCTIYIRGYIVIKKPIL